MFHVYLFLKSLVLLAVLVLFFVLGVCKWHDVLLKKEEKRQHNIIFNNNNKGG